MADHGAMGGPTHITRRVVASNAKIGDRVALKSGGPVMTIVALGREIPCAKVECMWFDDDADVQTCEFPVEALKEVG